MASILVVEDEADLRAVLEYNLRQAGHTVLSRATGAEGLRAADEHRPDLVILDIMLPDMSGFEVCKHLRRNAGTKSVPIIMASARTEEIDRVLGLELGADDYVVKPYSVRELMLRVQTILRRAGVTGDAPVEGAFVFGVLRVDRDAHRVWVDGVEVELTALEFKLLVTLYDRKNRVQSRAVLLNEVWDVRADIATRTVDTHIKRLREKLGAAGRYVETVRGVGYRFADSPESAGELEDGGAVSVRGGGTGEEDAGDA